MMLSKGTKSMAQSPRVSGRMRDTEMQTACQAVVAAQSIHCEAKLLDGGAKGRFRPRVRRNGSIASRRVARQRGFVTVYAFQTDH